MADPQVNPNALGAPTEGFGQTVTFAFDPRGVTPSLELAKSTGPRVGVSGVSQGQMQNPNQAYQKVRTDGTADLLMRVAGELIAPKLEEERNRKFVEGIQQAMNGEAAKDMVAEQPWYSRLFGDTPAIEGARAYEVSSKVNRVMADETANMDKVKHLGPKEAAAHYSQLLNKQLTGDPATDTLIAKTLVEQMPGLMKAQAKAHYGYGQKLAMDHLSTNMATASDALQQAGQLYAEDTINEADFAQRKQSFIASIMPPDGINEENYSKVLHANLKRAADMGHFHAVQAVRESGGFNALTPEQQNTLNAAITAAGRRHRDNYAAQFAEPIAKLRSDAAFANESPEAILGRYKQMNAAYTRLTGNPEGLFSSDEMANAAAGTLNYLKREELAAIERQRVLADRASTEQAKAVAQAEHLAAVDKYVAEGNIGIAKTYTKATNDEIDQAVVKRYSQDPVAGTAMLRTNFINSKYVNPLIASGMQAGLIAAEGLTAPPESFFHSVEQYKALRDGDGGTLMAQAYFGDYAPHIERYLRMTGDGQKQSLNVIPAFNAAMDRSGTMKAQRMSDKEYAGIAAEVAKTEGWTMPRWAGGKVVMRPEALEVAASIARSNIEDWQAVPGITAKDAVKHGIGAALTSGKLELIGGFAIRRGERDAKADTLRELGDKFSKMPVDEVDRYFEEFMHTKGLVPGSRAMIYPSGKDASGNPIFAASVMRDGVPEVVTFGGDEWSRFADRKTKTDTGVTPYKGSTWYRFGPALTYVPGKDTPSIYAGEAAWAAHRAAEARKVQPKQ